MGPQNAARIFLQQFPEAETYEITLFGSLAATGKGHLTAEAILEILPAEKTSIIWKEKHFWPQHPNALLFKATNKKGSQSEWLVFSVGGGAIRDLNSINSQKAIYAHKTFQEISAYCQNNGMGLTDYIYSYESSDLRDFLSSVWQTMQVAIKRGIRAEGVLPGILKLPRRAGSFYIKSKNSRGFTQKISRSFAYALAVSEENAAGGVIVTAPTCGSAGVLPAVLKNLEEAYKFSEEKIINALAIAGLIGNIIKSNASISGAEVGCQGEIGSACAMAAAAATYLLGGSISQIEYAAEMGLEHHLGLTCDPVAGLVQVPCIERNAMAAERALDCAVYSLLTDGTHKIHFDQVVTIMKQPGKDLKNEYRETAAAGLATLMKKNN